MSQTRAHASRSLFWSSVDIFSQTGFSILALALLARWLRIEDIGLGSLAITLVQLLTMPLELAFHDALVQRRELTPAHASSAFTATLVGSVIAAILLIVTAPMIASFYDLPALAPLLQIAALAIPFSGITAVVGALLRRNLEFAPLARRTVLGRMAGVVLGLAAAWYGAGAWSLVVMYLASITISTLVLMASRQQVPTWGLPYSALRELLGFAAPNMLAQLFLLANGRIFLALAGLQLGSVALGTFALAFRLIEELRSTLSTAAVQLALPLMSKRAHEPRQIAAVFTEATSFTACILLPLFAGMAIIAPDLLPLAFGDKWHTATGAAQWLSVAAVVMVFRQYSSISLNALGRPGLNAGINGTVFVASVFLLLADFSYFLSLVPMTDHLSDTDSVSFIWLLRAVLLVLMSWWGVRYGLGLSVKDQLKPLLVPLLATALMCAGLMALNHTFLQPSSMTMRLASDIGAGMVIYVASLLCISPSLFNRLMSFMLNALRPTHRELRA